MKWRIDLWEQAFRSFASHKGYEARGEAEIAIMEQFPLIQLLEPLPSRGASLSFDDLIGSESEWLTSLRELLASLSGRSTMDSRDLVLLGSRIDEFVVEGRKPQRKRDIADERELRSWLED